MVFEKVAKIIADYKDMDVSEIKPETLLSEDLELDSLDTVELVMSIEEEFDISLDMEEGIKTISDIVEMIEGQIENA